jgi:RNA polymerase subunit RPABC4/transcription elongation factor Spt4
LNQSKIESLRIESAETESVGTVRAGFGSNTNAGDKGLGMPVKNETSTRFMDEVRILSPWVYVLVGLGFLAAIAAVVYATRSGKPPFPLVAMVPLAIFGGTIVGCYILLIGYIYGDAARRGMSPLAWTLLAICVPNALGIVLYFVLRKPRVAICPQCGNALQPGFNFCPSCNHKLSPSCPQCQRVVGANDVYCPYCGTSLRNQGASVSSPPETLLG